MFDGSKKYSETWRNRAANHVCGTSRFAGGCEIRHSPSSSSIGNSTVACAAVAGPSQAPRASVR